MWLMGRQWGVLFEVRHLMLEPLEAPCCPSRPPPAARSSWGAHVQVAQREVAEVAGLQVQADAVVEGEPLAAGVGNCVARPGGPQQLLVLQPHAVVQPHSVRLHFRHGHKDALGYLSAGPDEAQPRPHPHALRAVLGCSLATPTGCLATQIYVDDLCLQL